MEELLKTLVNQSHDNGAGDLDYLDPSNYIEDRKQYNKFNEMLSLMYKLKEDTDNSVYIICSPEISRHARIQWYEEFEIMTFVKKRINYFKRVVELSNSITISSNFDGFLIEFTIKNVFLDINRKNQLP